MNATSTPRAAGFIRRKAVVTGAGQGLGRAMALGLLQAGHAVLLADRPSNALEETMAHIGGQHFAARAFSVAVDLTANDAVDTVMQAADRQLGGIDVLVNNAGVGMDSVRKDYLGNPPRFDDLSDDLVRLFFAVNGVAPLLLSIHAVRRMRKTGWGRIVNITTSNDSMMRAGFIPYGGTKASLEGHSAAMAQELAGSGITVNVLVPGGAADTGMIPDELGFRRSSLIAPETMVPPLLWFLTDGPDAPNGKRVLSVSWTPDAESRGDPSVRPIGWPGVGSKALIPQKA